jgi:hypothetical protein
VSFASRHASNRTFFRRKSGYEELGQRKKVLALIICDQQNVSAVSSRVQPHLHVR